MTVFSASILPKPAQASPAPPPSCLEIIQKDFKKLARRLQLFATEAFATIRHVIPSAIKWWIRKNITREIASFPFKSIEGPIETKGTLYLHGELNIASGEEFQPLLFVHGDYGHPYTLLHLIDIAKNTSKRPIFSLHLPNCHDNTRFHMHAALIEQAIDKIEALGKAKGGVFKGIYGIGHSKGAIQLVERQFSSSNQSRILKTFAIAGRLKLVENDESCQKHLRPIVQTIFQNINNYPDREFVQIIPKDDWNAPYEAMAVRPNKSCYTVPGMHLSGVYSPNTSELFSKFIVV